MPLINPKLDWLTSPVNPTSVDMNRIESNIDFINSEIETKKGAIVDALNGVGIATTLADTHAAIASKIIAAEKTGISILPSTINQAIPKGIYDTGGGVVLGDADLVANNIRITKTIFGVDGTLTSSLSVGDTPIYSDEVDKSTISLTPAKVAEVKILKEMDSLRVKFNYGKGSGFSSRTHSARIYLNGVAHSSIYSVVTSSSVDVVYDMTYLKPNDLIQLYIWTSNTDTQTQINSFSLSIASLISKII